MEALNPDLLQAKLPHKVNWSPFLPLPLGNRSSPGTSFGSISSSFPNFLHDFTSQTRVKLNISYCMRRENHTSRHVSLSAHFSASTVILQLNKNKTLFQAEAANFSCKSTSRSDKNKYLWTRPSLINTSCIYTNPSCPQSRVSALCPPESFLPSLLSDLMVTGWLEGL